MKKKHDKKIFRNLLHFTLIELLIVILLSYIRAALDWYGKIKYEKLWSE